MVPKGGIFLTHSQILQLGGTSWRSKRSPTTQALPFAGTCQEFVVGSLLASNKIQAKPPVVGLVWLVDVTRIVRARWNQVRARPRNCRREKRVNKFPLQAQKRGFSMFFPLNSNRVCSSELYQKNPETKKRFKFIV